MMYGKSSPFRQAGALGGAVHRVPTGGRRPRRLIKKVASDARKQSGGFSGTIRKLVNKGRTVPVTTRVK